MILAGAILFGVFSGIMLFFKSLILLNTQKTYLSVEINFFYQLMWLIFFNLFCFMMLQLFIVLGILGLVGVPSSVFESSMDSYLLSHMGFMGFMGMWFSLSIFCFIILLKVNEK